MWCGAVVVAFLSNAIMETPVTGLFLWGLTTSDFTSTENKLGLIYAESENHVIFIKWLRLIHVQLGSQRADGECKTGKLK